MPETAMLANITNAIRLLDPNFQWSNYSEYKEQKMQNDSCYLTKVRIETLIKLMFIRNVLTQSTFAKQTTLYDVKMRRT